MVAKNSAAKEEVMKKLEEHQFDHWRFSLRENFSVLLYVIVSLSSLFALN